MPTVRDQAICVRHWDWSETSQTVSLFTREQGLLRGIAKGARREKSSFSGGIEWLTRGEVVAIIKDTTALSTLTAWDLLDPYRGLRERLGAFHAAAFCAEIVLEIVQDADPHPRLFDALAASLGHLAEGVQAIHPVLLEFEWAAIVEAGLQPTLDLTARERSDPGDTVCLFDPETGGLVDAAETGHAWRVRGATIELLRRVSAGDPPEEGEHATRAARLLASYLSFRVGRSLSTAEPILGPLR